MKVVLGTFARSGIEDQLGLDIHAAAQAALAHYTRRLQSEWAPIGPPTFFQAQSRDGEDSLEIALEAETEAALEREAERHKVPIDQIFAHAVLTYLADIDGALAAAPVAASGPSAAPTV